MHILIVEDDADMQKILRLYLETVSYTHLSGRKGVKKCQIFTIT